MEETMYKVLAEYQKEMNAKLDKLIEIVGPLPVRITRLEADVTAHDFRVAKLEGRWNWLAGLGSAVATILAIAQLVLAFLMLRK